MPEQVALAAGALLVVAGAGTVVERLTAPAIRLLEGYHWPAQLFECRSKWHNKCVNALERIWAGLAAGLADRSAHHPRQLAVRGRGTSLAQVRPGSRLWKRMGLGK
ncbi:hypothetical protein [Microbispora bryophytorum]|uniref:hypothetical protein n=1 Tax=Microbispora bryophytorum TaxID=1460882 RepID=UPI0033EB54C7